MEKTEYLISIIVPVYNRASLISGCIESILCQTYRNFQLILIDDGSTDRSLSVCREYAARDRRVLVIHQDNRGPGGARNTGLDAARGEYIAFVDSDDRIYPRFLEIMYRALQSTNAEIAFCELTETGRFDEALPSFGDEPVIERLSSGRVLAEMLYGRAPSYCWGRLWKKAALSGLRFQALSFCEDLVFNVEALAGTVRQVAHVTGGTLYAYYRHPDSITVGPSAEALSDSLEAGEAILSVVETQPDGIRRAACSSMVAAAFYAYLNSSQGERSEAVRTRALAHIRRHRKTVLTDCRAPFKVRAACFLSCFSISLVRAVYRVMPKRR